MSNVSFEVYSAICATKARYCRHLDEKNWEAYGDVFTEDAVLDTRPSGGPEIVGRNELIQGVRASIGDAITVHQVHVPEMTQVDEHTVEVIWGMFDRVIWGESKAREIGRRSLTGYGHYREQYRHCDDGQWRIAKTQLTRLHIDFEPFAE